VRTGRPTRTTWPTPSSRRPRRPRPRGAPAAATEKRGENISALKNDLRRAWSARGMNREDVNALGRKLTGKEPSAFLFNATDLKRLMAGRRGGEMA
jgi:hypothetical protein